MRFRTRSRFGELAERQIGLVAADEADLLREAAEAEDAWRRAPREHAEEAYGDYLLVVDAISDRLLAAREAFAATLDAGTAAEYRTAFRRAAGRRFRRHPSILADLDEA